MGAQLSTQREVDDPGVIKALSHPLRLRILGTLEERTTSPTELAEELQVPLPNVSYHVRLLLKRGLIELAKTVPRRGAVEHYYRASAGIHLADRPWGPGSRALRATMLSSTLATTGKLVERAAAAGGFDVAEAHLIRQRLRLDRKAWKEASARIAELRQALEGLAEESEARRTANGDLAEVDAGVVLMLFEVEAERHASMNGSAARAQKTRTSARASA